jgi:transcription initiation factor TFIIB
MLKNSVSHEDNHLDVTMSTCPECDGTHLVHSYERGEVVCSTCGVVVARILDTGPEWWPFSHDKHENRGRVGAPLSPIMPDYGLRTGMGRPDRDSPGRPLSGEARTRIGRLRKIDNRTKQRETRSLVAPLNDLRRICGHLGISGATEECAAIYYRKCHKKGLVRGRSTRGIIAASIYLACRTQSIVLTLKELADVSRVNRKELNRAVRIILEELDVKPEVTDTRKLVERLGNQLGVTMYTIKSAMELLREGKERGITMGKSPVSLAAAALYAACVQTGERRTQDQIAHAAKTTAVTIRNRFKELVKELNLNLEVKRGAGSAPVYKDTPTWFKEDEGDTSISTESKV